MRTPGPLVIGPFPPPVGGAAHVTQHVTDAIGRAGGRPLVLDTSVATLAHQRGVGYHRTRLARAAHVLGRVVRPGRRFAYGYLVPDGGAGVWYSLAYAVATLTRTRRLVVHHHSCRYVDERDAAMAALTRATRARSEHVFLTPGMAEAFQELYGTVQSRVVTNAAFTARQTHVARTSGSWQLGHLSNLCREKGFFHVVDTFETLTEKHPSAQLTLAGPVLEADVAGRLEEVLRRFPDNVTYLGPLYGREKLDFYAGLDVFLFPTQFAQEAAPNVVYEAASLGVPTLATSRGRLHEITAQLGGDTVEVPSAYSDFVGRWLASHDPGELPELKAQVKARFEQQHLESQHELDSLANLLAR